MNIDKIFREEDLFPREFANAADLYGGRILCGKGCESRKSCIFCL